MHIKSITLNNFQCYFGEENHFTFTKGVNIITGNNGAGKSKLFNAFHWVLFGNIYTNHRWVSTIKDGSLKFVSNKAKSLTTIGNDIKCSVELVFEAPHYMNSEENVEYTFYREIIVKKNSIEFTVKQPEQLEIMVKNEIGETEYVETLQNNLVIENVFPLSLREYMWFQGEAIDTLIDFTNPNTLKRAIKKISYFPYYERINKITEIAKEIIQGEISKQIRKNNTNNRKLNELIEQAEIYNKNITTKRRELEELFDKYDEIEEKKLEAKNNLRSYDGFVELENKVNSILEEERNVRRDIDNLNTKYRENFITKWMLYGVEGVLKDTDKQLDKINDLIKKENDTNNPIPLKVPGYKFIQQMLTDQHCHICDRPAKVNSEPYKALLKRSNESEVLEKEFKERSEHLKNLEHNYTILANRPTEIRQTISTIHDEIKSWDKKLEKLIKERTRLRKEIQSLKKENIDEISQGAKTAQRLVKDYEYYEEQLRRTKRKIDDLNLMIEDWNKSKSENLLKQRKYANTNENTPHQRAEKYFEILENIINKLKEDALVNLINNIESKSNELYLKYLENSTSPNGYIEIDKDTYNVMILDNGQVKDINQGHEIAAKMSVINSILYLSSQKIGKSYPLVADAPSSVFDITNTKSYTEKISQTFEQVILMSKDYSSINEISYLKKLNNINSIYKIENKATDIDVDNSEVNNSTLITKIK